MFRHMGPRLPDPAPAVLAPGRTAATDPWGAVRPWSPGGSLRPPAAGGPVASAGLGAAGTLQALWTSSSGALAATGTSARGGGPVRVPLPSGAAASELRIAAVPGGAAYVVVAARPGAPATPLAGRSAGSGAVSPPVPLAARTTHGAPAVQLGADAAGDLTAAWIGDGNALQTAVLPADATAWTTTALTGAAAAPRASPARWPPGGRALLALQADLAIAPAANGVPFLASAALATYAAPAPSTGAAVGASGQALVPAAPINDAGAAFVGYAVRPPGNSPPQLFGGAVEAASAAIDPQGTATLTWTQPFPVETGAGVVVQVATSTAAAPAWASGVDPTAGCPPAGRSNRGTLAAGPLAAVPAGGVVLAFQCNGPAGSPAPAVPAVAAFDALGPPVSRFALSAGRVTLVLAEPATYTLTAAAPGRPGRTLRGRAAAGATVSHAFAGLRAGRYSVTLVARLANGNTTRLTRSTSVT